MTTNEPVDLASIQARADAATPGPWHVYAAELESSLAPHFGVEGELHIGFGYGWENDAEFMTHARTDIPALVAEVIRLRAMPRLTAEEARVILLRDSAPLSASRAARAKLRDIAEHSS
jgi:hypothetical protein